MDKSNNIENNDSDNIEVLSTDQRPPESQTNNDSDCGLNDIDTKDPKDHIKDIKSDTLIIFKNPDKKNRIRVGEEPYMPYSGSRILFSGPPNSGKRNQILNLIWRAKPKPSAIHIVHFDPFTEEYDCLNDLGIPCFIYGPSDFPTKDNIVSPLTNDQLEDDNVQEIEIPIDMTNQEELDMHNKRLSTNPWIIVDEITHDTLSPICRSRFERLINQIATHHNCIVLCSIQSLLNIGPKVRRGFNHYCVWKQFDKQLNQMIAQRASIDSEVLEDLFKLCESRYDHIWVDLDEPTDSPYRYRLNMIYPISFDNP